MSDKMRAENPNLSTIISPALALAIERGSSWEDLPISDELVSAQETFVQEQMGKLRNAFHDQEHSLEVARRAYRYAANTRRFSEQELRLLYLAGLYHDFGHCGQTLRQKTIGGKLSNEEFAAVAFDEQLGSHLGIAQRLTAQGLILATSFGQSGANIESSLRRDYRPNTELETILQFADIANVDASFEAFLVRGGMLVAEMRPGGSAPTSWAEFLEFEITFLRYLGEQLKKMETILCEEDLARVSVKLQEATAIIARLRFESLPGKLSHLACPI